MSMGSKALWVELGDAGGGYCPKSLRLALRCIRPSNGVPCGGLTHVCMAMCSTLTDSGLAAVVQHCPGLQSLDVSHCKALTNAALYAVANSCRELKTFSAEGCVCFADEGVKVRVRCPCRKGPRVLSDVGLGMTAWASPL